METSSSNQVPTFAAKSPKTCHSNFAQSARWHGLGVIYILAAFAISLPPCLFLPPPPETGGAGRFPVRTPEDKLNQCFPFQLKVLETDSACTLGGTPWHWRRESSGRTTVSHLTLLHWMPDYQCPTTDTSSRLSDQRCVRFDRIYSSAF